MNKFHGLSQSHPNFLAAICTMVSTFSMSSITLFVKLIPSVPTYQIIQTYSLAEYFLLFPVSQNFKYPTYKCSNSLLALLIFRCLTSFFTTICWFKGALYLSVAETEMIYNLSVIWTTIYAVFIKRTRRLTPSIFLIFTLLFSGIYCIQQSKSAKSNQSYQDPSNRLYGIALLILGSFFNSLIEISQNQLGSVHKMLQNNILMTMYVVSIFCTSIYQILFPNEEFVRMLTLVEYATIVIIAICFIIGLYTYNVAFSFGELSSVSVLQLLTLIYGFLFDIFIFNLIPSFLTILGALLISSGILLNLLVPK